MKRRFVSFLVMMTLGAFLSVACDDNPKKDKNQTQNQNTQDQNQNTQDQNQNTQDQNQNTQDQNCTGSSCDVVENEPCNQDTFEEECVGETAVFCGDDGKVVKRDCSKRSGTCHISVEDGYADCVEPCTSSDTDHKACENDSVMMHLCLEVEDGGMYEYAFSYYSSPCEYGCENGACKDRPEIQAGSPCTQSICHDEKKFECEDGKYVVSSCTGNTVCQPNADGSKISCATKPVDGAPCDNQTWIDTCVDGGIAYCNVETDTVTIKPCDYKCRYAAEGQGLVNYAECVTPCDEDTDPYEPVCSMGWLNDYQCLKGTDGNLWLFPVDTLCKNGCKSGKCL